MVRLAYVQFIICYLLSVEVFKKKRVWWLRNPGLGAFCSEGHSSPAGPTQAACSLAFMLATEGTQPQVGRALSCWDLST